jgi:hypothetical protein
MDATGRDTVARASPLASDPEVRPLRASPPPAPTSRIPLAWRLGALAAVAVLYLATRQTLFTIDSLYYLWDTEFGEPARLLHPHHLALQPLFRAVWVVWDWFGWPGRAVLPLQVLNTGLTVATLAVFWRLLGRLGLNDRQAAVWWGLLAVCFLTWQQATQTEGYPLYALFATLLLERAVRLGQGPAPTCRTMLAVAAVLAGGVLVHQALVLWSPLVAWMIGRAAPPGRRWSLAAGCLVIAGSAVLACYLLAAELATGGLHPAELWAWFTGYTDEFAGRYGRLSLLFSSEVPRGLASSVLSGLPLKPYVYGDRSPDLALTGILLPFLLVVVVLGVGLGRLVVQRSALADPTRRAAVNLVLLMAVAALFAGWWDPGNRKFWGPVLVPALALAALGWRDDVHWSRRWRVAPSVLLVALLGFNLLGGALPRHRAQDARQPLLTFLARSVQPGDVVILREDRLWQCAQYFRPDRTVHGIPGALSDRDDPEHTVRRRAVTAALEAYAAGQTVYVAGSQLDVVIPPLADRFGPLPVPRVALEYGDPDLHDAAQQLHAISRSTD